MYSPALATLEDNPLRETRFDVAVPPKLPYKIEMLPLSNYTTWSATYNSLLWQIRSLPLRNTFFLKLSLMAFHARVKAIETFLQFFHNNRCFFIIQYNGWSYLHGITLRTA